MSFPGHAQQPQVILKGHAHNDYTHKRPLYDALENGFFSVEVDVFYADGKFLVAHTRLGIRKKNTLKRLYLEPLTAIVQQNEGRVYKDGPLEFVMMIDLKGKWDEKKLDGLEKEIKTYSEFFTVFNNGVKEPGAVRIIISNAGGFKEKISSYDPRYFSVDGRPNDLESDYDHQIVPRISSNYNSIFSWKGRGEFPEEEEKRLGELVSRAHAQGRKIRFWATPDREGLWRELLDAGVDWINVDKLNKFRKFYLEYYGN